MSRELDTKVIGLIVPPIAGEVPPEGAMYPEFTFLAEGLGLREVTPEGYDEVIDNAVNKAQKLAKRGAEVISLMGTSLSFYRGYHANSELIRLMHEATGLPCTTMSQAILNALKALKVKKLAVATSYVEEVNDKLLDFLTAENFQPLSCEWLGESGVEAMAKISTAELVELCRAAYKASASAAEGILLSCGGLRTLEVIQIVEQELGVPVIASSPAGFWDVVGLTGQRPSRKKYGKLAAIG